MISFSSFAGGESALENLLLKFPDAPGNLTVRKHHRFDDGLTVKGPRQDDGGMPAPASGNDDFNIFGRTSDRNGMHVFEPRRTDRHQPPAPYHRRIVDGAQMD